MKLVREAGRLLRTERRPRTAEVAVALSSRGGAAVLPGQAPSHAALCPGYQTGLEMLHR